MILRFFENEPNKFEVNEHHAMLLVSDRKVNNFSCNELRFGLCD